MRRALLVTLIAVVVCVAAAPSTPAAEQAIYRVQVLHVNQQPYQPVAFRIAVDGSVGDLIFAGFKVWDTAGHGVYSPSLTKYTQPYQATALTLHWSKRGYDGNPVPTGRRYVVEAAASDATVNGKLIFSQPFYFTLTS